MQTYTFTLQAPGGFIAKVALSGTCSLYQLAETLIQALDFDFDHCFGFYDNLRNPYQSEEKYTLFADIGEAEDNEPGVRKTLIQDVFKPRKRLCFHFDYGDDWMFLVRCDSVVDTSSSRKTRKILKRTGTAPVQYEYPDDEGEFEED